MKRFYISDKVILAVHELVDHLPAPTDTPVAVASVCGLLGWPVGRVVALLPDLEEQGFLVTSPIGDPPLLYLTRTGMAFSRRRKQAA